MCGMPPAANIGSLLRSMRIRSGMLKTIALHDLAILLDVSEASTFGELPTATRPCLSSRVSGLMRCDRYSSFKIVHSKFQRGPINWEVFFPKVVPCHGFYPPVIKFYGVLVDCSQTSSHLEPF